MKKRCAIYCRVSTSNLGQDIDRQIHECHRYAEMMGYEIVETYQDEGFARTTRNRPALDKLIKDARQRKFSMVISDELSRFAGTPVLLLNLLEELKLWNVHIVSVKESIDTNTPMGEIVGTMQITEQMSARLIRLPLWVGINQAQQERIIQALHTSL